MDTRGSLVRRLVLPVALLGFAVGLPIRMGRATGETWDRFQRGMSVEEAATATAPFDAHGYLLIGAWMFTLPALGLGVLALLFAFRDGAVARTLLVVAAVCWLFPLLITRVYYAPWWLAVPAVLVCLAAIVVPLREGRRERSAVRPVGVP